MAKNCCEESLGNRELYNDGKLWCCKICGCGGFTKKGYQATRQGTLHTLVRRGKIIILNQEA
jgi:hypothetical protein